MLFVQSVLNITANSSLTTVLPIRYLIDYQIIIVLKMKTTNKPEDDCGCGRPLKINDKRKNKKVIKSTTKKKKLI